MISINTVTAWGMGSLLWLIVLVGAATHIWKFEERLKELNVFKDKQLQYFWSCVKFFLFGFAFAGASLCCALMVHADFARLGL